MTNRPKLTMNNGRVGVQQPDPAASLAPQQSPEVPDSEGTSLESGPLPTASGQSATSDHLTQDDLLQRAKAAIASGETTRLDYFREAAEDIALARHLDGKLSQKKIGLAVGKSAPWVCRLLKWRDEGYAGHPFADKIIAGVNAPPSPADLDPPNLWNGETNAASARPTESVSLVPSIDPVTREDSDPSSEHSSDVVRALEELTFQWAAIPFRARFLDSPREAQEKFLREVVLAEMQDPGLLLLPKTDAPTPAATEVN